MANRHKVTIYVKPTRRTVNVEVRGVGNILRLPLSGFSLSLPGLPIPTTTSKNAYLQAIMNIVLDALEAEEV